MMEGQVGVESVEGEGSTFWATMRLKRLPQDAVKEIQVPEFMPDLSALVIEPNRTVGNILCRELKDFGGVASQETTIYGGFEALSKDTFDLVFLDGSLPGRDAFFRRPAQSGKPAGRAPDHALSGFSPGGTSSCGRVHCGRPHGQAHEAQGALRSGGPRLGNGSWQLGGKPWKRIRTCPCSERPSAAWSISCWWRTTPPTSS